jgi:hypothetical protein
MIDANLLWSLLAILIGLASLAYATREANA